MKIVSLTQVGYRGFRLKKIDYFDYRPTRKTQAVLGTNGSGKSSLLKELSPLPADLKSDYAKGGYKKIVLDHAGKIYTLTSMTDTTGPKHIFEVDGENLNPGHTVTVFKELVKQHFNGYTPELHQLLTGRVKFCTMSVADRRAWLTRISDIDFTYALKYHRKIKDKIRDLQGAIKRSKENLVQETNLCLSEEQEAVLRKEVEDLRRVLDDLVEKKKPRTIDIDQIKARANAAEGTLKRALGGAERLIQSLEGQGTIPPIEALQEASVALSVEIQVLRREIGDRAGRLDKYQKDLDIVNQTSSLDLEAVQKEIQALDSEAKDITETVKHHIHYDDPDAAKASFLSIRSGIEAIYQSLQDLERRDYTQDEYRQLKDRLAASDQVVQKANAAHTNMLIHLKQLEEHLGKGETHCPKCQHRWILNYSEETHRIAKQKLEEAASQAEHARQAKEKLQAEYNECYQFFTLLDQLRLIRSSTPSLQPYWNWVDQKKDLFVAPEYLSRSTSSIYVDLVNQVNLKNIQARLEELRKVETLSLNAKALDKDKLTKAIEEENQLLVLAQNKLRQASHEQENVSGKIEIHGKILEYRQSIEDAFKVRDASIRLLLEDASMEILGDIVRFVNYVLWQKDRKISQIDIQRGIVKSLTTQIETMESELRLLKLAEKSLSPSEGLIARGMTGFINHFVKKMNSFIEKIWLYPLEIIPVENTSDEIDLDYKFSVLVDKEHPVPDISVCSTGMQEVINLAFVAVSMKYLHLTQFPIYLDEFAASMDPAHRQSAYRAIDLLIDATDYSQVYLVSHYRDGYSSLSDAEILVLCDNNVQVPPHLVYNQHVTMK